MKKKAAKKHSTKDQIRSSETRELLYQTAVALFRTEGYDETTMRKISAESGLSLGLLYYHFQSKQEIVLEFYKRTQQDSDRKCRNFFSQNKDLKKRILFIVKDKLDQFKPYRNFLYVLSRSAGDPFDPLSPFSTSTAATRNEALEIISAALTDSNVKIAVDFKRVLIFSIWMYQLGIIYLSLRLEDQKKLEYFMESSAEILIKMIKFSSFSIFKKFRLALSQTLERLLE
ncbi:MAG TPA: TetR/AcrR family transcriptional regulator [Leptospiraceae bacterium]|nr:TetR/AcrR family transcriptional regulator [Leptospiraceae bacterium]HMY66802.1 TetR/AcrR family transcriptional regulator [Leptospiraceae bacterium]HNF14943.1 TetR/AcrR family transcriptional regulator [Leptospiraceae bacterium]HNF27248.1 TetR/AcrR family transcriptional regulator [Leptospiraceae bacterium]HNI97989.1 TetR/AcrR family transcriptional regulator [Leptospiraceae bacterium]